MTRRRKAQRRKKMKTDIQIAQEAKMEHIRDVAARAGIMEDELEFYGKYKAKLSDELWDRIKDREDGKLVLVTAINPTPAGEGKTTTSIGLGQAMAKLGKILSGRASGSRAALPAAGTLR